MQNQTKILMTMATALMMFGAGSAMAHTTHDDEATRTGFLPATVDVEGVAGVGAAACSDLAAPIACGNGGVGVFFFFDEPGVDPIDSPHATTAMFTCGVSYNADGNAGPIAVTCGVDRDDDTFVTNVDATNEDNTGNPMTDHEHRTNGEYNSDGNPDTTDDVGDDAYFTFVTDEDGQGSDSGCFAHDAEGSGDHDWDDAVVFLGVSAPSVPAIGSADVTLSYEVDHPDNGNDC